MFSYVSYITGRLVRELALYVVQVHLICGASSSLICGASSSLVSLLICGASSCLVSFILFDLVLERKTYSYKGLLFNNAALRQHGQNGFLLEIGSWTLQVRMILASEYSFL